MPAYDTELLKAYLDRHEIGAMDMVRLCDISVSLAYKIVKGKPIKDLDVLYRVYTGLSKAGYPVSWKEITGIY